jgi:hypothetical protein
MTLNIPEAVVREWYPTIHVSEHVTSGSSIAQFTDRARSGYVAPPLQFEPPSAMIVGGRNFAVVSREHGLIESSTHTLGKYDCISYSSQSTAPVYIKGLMPRR